MVRDSDFMSQALALAEKGRGRTSPNPMVGAVVVRPDGAIVGRGYHERAGGPHAEVRALDEARELARGASLYCNLEPCCHVGKTGPCVERIVEAGIARVVAAAEDPNPLVSGRGFDYLRRQGLAVEVGLEQSRATELNRVYLTFRRQRRPFVIVKAAISLDNRVAARPGVRTDVTSEEACHHAHGVRAEVDAIGVGSETVIVDDPLLTARRVQRERPLLRVLFDRRLRIPPTARVFSTLEAGPVIIMTTLGSIADHQDRVRALEAAGARLEPISEGDLAAALSRLAELDVTSLLVEGGPRLHASLCQSGLVDAAHVYIAPDTLGAEGVSWLDEHTFSLAALANRRVSPFGRDVLIEGYVHRPH